MIETLRITFQEKIKLGFYRATVRNLFVLDGHQCKIAWVQRFLSRDAP